MSYFYLISGLPDLALDTSPDKIDFEETFDVIQRNLEHEDQEQFGYLLYPNDNRNLLDHLFHGFKDLPEGKFLKPFTLSPEVVQSYRREQSNFPGYMVEFIRETETQFQTLTMREMENRLQAKFEAQLAKLESGFIQDYFQFKNGLKRLLALFNQTQYDFLSKPTFQDENRVLDSLKKGQMPNTAVLKTYPFAEPMKEVMATSDPSQIERFVEQIEWEYLLGPFPAFQSEQVLAYAARLLILYRKKQQNTALGATRFEKLKKDIRNKAHSPKTPLV